MKITSGMYRGVEIELGIVPRTDGQAYANLTLKHPKLKTVLSFINDELIRRSFDLPKKDVDHSFRLEVSKEKNELQWFFMFSILKECTQYEYLYTIFKGIDLLFNYSID